MNKATFQIGCLRKKQTYSKILTIEAFKGIYMKAKSGIGSQDYDCQQDWPEGAFLQCGKKGVVISRTKDKPSYQTAFFEAFPQNPATFIRGEGETVELAELNAFKKYEKIMACEGHEFKRRGESESGSCTKCGLFMSDIFPPVHACVECGKKEVNYSHGEKYYCREHFVQVTDKLKENYNLSNLKKIMEKEIEENKESSLFTETQMDIYSLEDNYLITFALKYGQLDLNVPEYKEANRLEKVREEFTRFVHNRLVRFYNENKDNINKELKNESLEYFEFVEVRDKVFLVQDLIESMYVEFIKHPFECYESRLSEVYFILVRAIKEKAKTYELNNI